MAKNQETKTEDTKRREIGDMSASMKEAGDCVSGIYSGIEERMDNEGKSLKVMVFDCEDGRTSVRMNKNLEQKSIDMKPGKTYTVTFIGMVKAAKGEAKLYRVFEEL